MEGTGCDVHGTSPRIYFRLEPRVSSVLVGAEFSFTFYGAHRTQSEGRTPRVFAGPEKRLLRIHLDRSDSSALVPHQTSGESNNSEYHQDCNAPSCTARKERRLLHRGWRC